MTTFNLENGFKMLQGEYVDQRKEEDSQRESLRGQTEPDHLVEVLKKANRMILNQHMAVMEEQRLNVLFQILGITFHELNQPLTSLLGNIELMLLNQNHPDKLKENIKRVEDAGKRFSAIIRKIQSVRQGKTLIQDTRFCPMKTNKIWKVQSLLRDEKVSRRIRGLLEGLDGTLFSWIDIPEVLSPLAIQEDTDLILLDEKTCLSESNTDLIRSLRAINGEWPILAVLRNKNEKLAFRLIQEGVDDYFILSESSPDRFIHLIYNVKERAWARHQWKTALNDLACVSIQDEGTGLFQRRFFKDALDRETTMARRREAPCIACRLDIEGISACYNSNAIFDAAKLIQNSLGDATDLVCRYGNESFAFILANTEEDQARSICQGLQSELERRLGGDGLSDPPPKVHMGMILFSPAVHQSTQELMKKLDEATSQAKILGKSLVMV